MTKPLVVRSVVSCDHPGCPASVQITSLQPEDPSDGGLGIARRAAVQMGWSTGLEGKPSTHMEHVLSPKPPGAVGEAREVRGEGRDLCPFHAGGQS